MEEDEEDLVEMAAMMVEEAKAIMTKERNECVENG
jgi:hypothetical protein